MSLRRNVSEPNERNNGHDFEHGDDGRSKGEKNSKEPIDASATSREELKESEERIVLRCTDDTSMLSHNDSLLKGTSDRPPQTKATSGAAIAVGSATHSDSSELNSDDDAASIVSRLSQIIFEQEEKLLGSLDSDLGGRCEPRQTKSLLTLNKASGSSGQQQKQLEANKGDKLRPINARVKSSASVNLNKQRKGLRAIGPKSPKTKQMKAPPSFSSPSPSSSSSCSISSPMKGKHLSSVEQLPEIHIVSHEEQTHKRPQLGFRFSSIVGDDNDNDNDHDEHFRPIRARTQSVAIARSSGFQEPIVVAAKMRRNESSGYLPERGNLRNLESSRKSIGAALEYALPRDSLVSSRPQSSAATRVLDRTVSNDGESDAGRLFLASSTWTLSEFDQTFNKSSQQQASDGQDEKQALFCSENELNMKTREKDLTESISASALENQQQQATIAGNLPLIKVATKNALAAGKSQLLNVSSAASVASQKSQSERQRVGSISAAMSLINCERKGSYDEWASERRPSHAHSIVSFASSMDSFYAGDGKSVCRGVPRVIKRGDRGGGGGDDYGAGAGSKRTSSRSTKAGGQARKEPGSRLGSCFNMRKFRKRLPILEWLPAYKLTFLWGDIMAGMAVAVLNISTSLSAAVVAETELGVAFRASIVNTFVYAILCSSRHTSFGSWSIMSQMLLVSVRRALTDELILNRLNLGPEASSWDPETYEMWHLNIIIMFTFLIGLVQLLSGLLNLGSILASFIPEPLCSSMIAATALTMAVGQLANMCGTSNKILLSIERNSTELWLDLKNPPVDITDLFAGLFRWAEQIALLVKHYDQINPVCVIISVSSVILLFLNQNFIQVQLEQKFKRKIFIPFEMILLVAMIIISHSLNLSQKYSVLTCGPIQIDFGIPALPNLRLIRELWFQSLATAIISFTMVYIMAKTYSNKLNYEVDSNQELIACGAGNLIGGLFDALPATASFSRTTAQVEAGGRTQMASIINCILLVVLARLFGHHVALLPVCVMSAALFYGFVRMMTRLSEALMYWSVCKVDFAIWMVTFVAILTLDMVNGFVYGFIFSILTMLYRAQNRRCYMLGTIGISDVYVPLVKYPVAKEIEGVKIFQFCGPIHYVCADLFERLLRQKTRVNVKQISAQIEQDEQLDRKQFNPRDMNLPTHVILDFSMISYIDSAGIHIIKKIIEDFNQINITILLASLASHVATVVKSEPSIWNVYKERFYVTLAGAVERAIRDGRTQQSVIAASNIVYEC